jgi:hypothetical protein
MRDVRVIGGIGDEMAGEFVNVDQNRREGIIGRNVGWAR